MTALIQEQANTHITHGKPAHSRTAKFATEMAMYGGDALSGSL